MADEERPIVLDNGSGSIKVGFAGEDGPQFVFPNIVGRPRKGVRFRFDHKDLYIGDEAQMKRGVLSLKYPIERGVVDDWTDMSTVWQYAFNQLKSVAGTNFVLEDSPLLITEPPLNPTRNREKMAEVVLEDFNFPAMYVAVDSISLFASGRTTGVMLSCGDGITYTTAMYEGFPVSHANNRVDFAGRDITDFLVRTLTEQNLYLNSSSGRQIVRDIKEKLAYVALNYDKEMKEFGPPRRKNPNFRIPNKLQKSYQLPDGKKIILTSELIRATETLFQPAYLGLEAPPIHDLVLNTIMKCALDTRRSLFSNIVLTGGTTLLPGFVDRFYNEIEPLIAATNKVKVISPPERKYSIWIGGSRLASLSTFQKMWVTQEEYFEHGASIFHSKLNPKTGKSKAESSSMPL